jgi:hypothetical protein
VCCPAGKSVLCGFPGFLLLDSPKTSPAHPHLFSVAFSEKTGIIINCYEKGVKESAYKRTFRCPGYDIGRPVEANYGILHPHAAGQSGAAAV